MRLRDLVSACGNDWRFIKVYLDFGEEERVFDKNKPDYIYSDKRYVPSHILDKELKCWHADTKNNDLEVLIG